MKDYIIIGVHGLLNKNSHFITEKWWKEAILEGLKKNCHYYGDIEFSLLYWADLLHKYPLHNDDHFFFDELYNTEPYIEAQSQKFARFSHSFLKRMELFKQNIQRKLVNLLQKQESISFWAANKYFRDMAYYYNEEIRIYDRNGQRKSLREILMNELITEIKKHQGKRIIIIGHSMGAIISYDVLRNLRSFVKDIDVVDGLCTLGAPLSYAIAYKHPLATLTDGHFRQKLRTPTVVDSWYNFTDPRDLACYKLKLSSIYAPNRAGTKVIDRLVHNEYEAYNQLLGKMVKNPHKSFGYLRCPEFSRVIKRWIQV
nr:alpha/beta hydrolase [Fangia hongkongensis]